LAELVEGGDGRWRVQVAVEGRRTDVLRTGEGSVAATDSRSEAGIYKVGGIEKRERASNECGKIAC
jgi:hypothetical protein